MANSRSWILPDTVIARRADDRLDLHSVAQELAEAVKSSTTSSAIGLLAPYGTGKSSVIRMAEGELAVNREWAVLRVSAENHSGIARARALLYSLLDAAHDSGLIDDDEHETQRSCLEGTRQRAVPRPSRTAGFPGKASSKRYLRAVAAGSALVFTSILSVWLLGAVLVLLGHTLGHGAKVRTWTWFATPGGTPLSTVLLTTPLLVWGFGQLREVLVTVAKRPEISITTPRPDTTDELEQSFLRLLRAVKRRIVIAIDDIDRLPATDVLDALATVRSLILAAERFPQQPVFVLSCDEDIVREAITGIRPGLASHTDDGLTDAKQEAAREYLNKLFAARIPLPAHQESDLRDFALAKLTEPTPHPVIAMLGGVGPTQDVLDVLIHHDVRTPRDTVRLLNEFLVTYRLADRREIASPGRPPAISPGAVTGYPLTLARIVVLRADFRRLYERVMAEHQLLEVLDEALLGNVGVLDDPILSAFFHEEGSRRPNTVDWPGLDFLRATAPRDGRTRPLEIGALLTLSSVPASRQLGSRTATEIQRELVSRDTDGLLQRFDDLRNIARLLNAITRTLETARRGQDRDNAVGTALTVLGRVPDLPAVVRAGGDDARAVLTVTDHVMRRLPDVTVPSSAADLAGLLPIVRESHVPALIAALSKLPDARETQWDWASVLLRLAHEYPAPQFDAAIDEYFVSLCEIGTVDDLQFWLDRTGDHELFTPHAFGALIAMAGRSEKADLLTQSVEAVVEGVDRHGWHTDLAYGLMAFPEQVDLDMNTALRRLLQQIDVPADGWAGTKPARPQPIDPSLAAHLVKRMTDFLIADDDDADSSGETAELLRSWVPILGHLPSAVSGKSIGDSIAECIAEHAGSCHEVAVVAAAMIRDLSDGQAAAVVTKVAAELEQHRDEDDPVGPVLFSMLLDYVRSAPSTSESAAGTCLDALLAVVAEAGTAGRFIRMRLPSVLATSRGGTRRERLLELLIAGLSTPVSGAAPGDGLNGELLTSLHVVITDPAIRTIGLPRILGHLRGSLAQNHAPAALDFMSRYATDTTVDITWLSWAVQHWAALAATTKNHLLTAAARPEMQQTGMLPLLTNHLLESTDDDLWGHAPVLYAAVDEDRKARILAAARGRCPDLMALVTDAPTDLIQQAMVYADHDVAAVVNLVADNPALPDAVNDYLLHCIEQTAWYPDRAQAAVAASTTPSTVWDLCLTEASRSETAAERVADIIESLLLSHPASEPADLVTRLSPVLRDAGEGTVHEFGTALKSVASRTLARFDTELKESGPIQKQARRQAFRAGSGYRASRSGSKP